MNKKIVVISRRQNEHFLHLTLLTLILFSCLTAVTTFKFSTPAAISFYACLLPFIVTTGSIGTI